MSLLVWCWQQTSISLWIVLLCYSGTVWEPITQIGATDKDPLPLVQMSKAFMKSLMWFNLIQPTKTSCISHKHNQSLWLPLLSPSLLIDKQLRETADCSTITTKCLVIRIRKPCFITHRGANMVQSSVDAFFTSALSFALGILIISVVSLRTKTRVCS